MSQSSEQDPTDFSDDRKSGDQPVPGTEEELHVLKLPQEVGKTSLPPRRAKAKPSLESVIGVTIGEPVIRLGTAKNSQNEEEQEAIRLKVDEPEGANNDSVVKLTHSIPAGKDPLFQPLPAMTPLISQASAETVTTQEWGRSTQHSYRWVWWGGGLVALLTLISLLVQPLLSLRRGVEPSTYYDTLSLEERPVDMDEATVFFTTNLEIIDRQCRQALTIYARARSLADALPVIRKSSSLSGTLEREWKPWDVEPDWAPDPGVLLGYASVGERPYAFIEGELPNFQHYAVFFVREGDQMLVDWEATVAHGSVPFEKLSDSSIRAATHRGSLLPVSYYSTVYPESEYQAYRFDHITRSPHVWVYAKRGSAAAEALNELFQTGFILEQIDIPQRVKLKLRRGSPESLSNQWEIVDVLHKGWVSP